MQIVGRVAWALLAVCVAMVSFWPVRTGSFVTGEDVFRLTSSVVTHPWSAFYSSHFFEPYDYRPVGLVFWWCACALMSDSFVGHVFVNVLLRLGNACSLFFCYGSGGRHSRIGRAGRFVDVTEAVRKGERGMVMRGRWAFLLAACEIRVKFCVAAFR